MNFFFLKDANFPLKCLACNNIHPYPFIKYIYLIYCEECSKNLTQKNQKRLSILNRCFSEYFLDLLKEEKFFPFSKETNQRVLEKVLKKRVKENVLKLNPIYKENQILFDNHFCSTISIFVKKIISVISEYEVTTINIFFTFYFLFFKFYYLFYLFYFLFFIFIFNFYF